MTKWEYLIKTDQIVREKMDEYIANNPIDKNGKKMSFNKIVNLALRKFLKIK